MRKLWMMFGVMIFSSYAVQAMSKPKSKCRVVCNSQREKNLKIVAEQMAVDFKRQPGESDQQHIQRLQGFGFDRKESESIVRHGKLVQSRRPVRVVKKEKIQDLYDGAESIRQTTGEPQLRDKHGILI